MANGFANDFKISNNGILFYPFCLKIILIIKY